MAPAQTHDDVRWLAAGAALSTMAGGALFVTKRLALEAASGPGPLAAAASWPILGSYGASAVLFVISLTLFLMRRTGAMTAYWAALALGVAALYGLRGAAYDPAFGAGTWAASVALLALLVLAGVAISRLRAQNALYAATR